MNIISAKLRCLHLTFSSVIVVGGVGASCPCWLILPHAQDLGQAMSSVNSSCTIILEYLVVRDVNIISVKLRCLHLMFCSVILVRRMRGKLFRLVYVLPGRKLRRQVFSWQSIFIFFFEKWKKYEELQIWGWTKILLFWIHNWASLNLVSE